MPKKKITKSKKIAKLSLDAAYIGAESANTAKTIAYGCRWLIMATMPYRKTNEPILERKNGSLSIRYMAGKPGMPYGPKPRLIGTWLETEMVRTKDRTIKLGDTFTEFVKNLGYKRTNGGRLYSAIREQSRRLFASTVQVTQYTKNSYEQWTLPIAPKASLWWSEKSPDQMCLYESTIKVGEDYFNEVIENPVPLDMRALQALKGSAFSLDIYRWYASRLVLVRTKEPVFIDWRGVEKQFGAQYQNSKEGRKMFKRMYMQNHKNVAMVYRAAKVEFVPGGLLLHHSDPPVYPKNRALLNR